MFATWVTLVTAIAFSPSLRNGFVEWDDTGLIVENAYIRRLGWEQIRWMFTSFHMGPYQPLPWLTVAIDYRFWGLNPKGYHLSSLLWHSATALSFFVLARRLLLLALPDWTARAFHIEAAAAIAAIVFGVHPLRVESVAWASERRDVLSGFFAIWTVWAYLEAVRPDCSRGRWARWLVLSCCMFCFSLLSKATGMCLPAVLSILDVYPLRRLGNFRGWLGAQSRPIWLEKVPFWLLGVAAGASAMYGQQSTGAMTTVEAYGPLDRLALAGFGSAFYVRKTLLPFGLSPLYEIATNFAPTQLRFIVSGLATLAITAIAVRFGQRWPGLLAAWLSYLALLAPVSGLAQTGPQEAADRYSYMSCMSFAILLAGGLLRGIEVIAAARRHATILLTFVSLAVAGLLGQLTWRQSQIWRNTGTLWTRAITVDPMASLAYNNVAQALIKENKPAEALRLLQKSLVLRPRNADAQNNIAIVYRRMGQPYAAMEHYLTAERLRPKFAEIQYNIGLLLAEEPLLDQLGFDSIESQWRAAHERYEKALAFRPDHLKSLNDVGILFKKMGQLDRAVDNYQQVLRIDPDNSNAHYNLAIALTEQSQLEAAERQYRSVLVLQPKHPAASNNLALLLERREQFREAVQVLQAGLIQTPNHETLLFNLSRILATAQDPEAR